MRMNLAVLDRVGVSLVRIFKIYNYIVVVVLDVFIVIVIVYFFSVYIYVNSVLL